MTTIKKFGMMKKTLLMLMLCITSFGLCSCVSTRDAVKVNKVELGMSKDDIRHLLGTPLFRNANEHGEEWGYRKLVGEVAGPEPILFIVTFDVNGKVIAYDSVKDHPHYQLRER
jgi:outer membrane protein assembly factor BamE (lipoprotein component of BamABCDE complex)